MANKKLNAVIQIGGTVTSAFKSALGTVKTGLTEIGSSIKTLERRQQLLGGSIQKLGKAGLEVDALRKKYAAVTAEIDKLRQRQERLNSAHAGMDRGRAMMGRGAVGIGVATAAALPAIGMAKQAADFETAMLGVAKQVDGARDAGGKLTPVYHQMYKEIQQLGREIPIATNELAEMVAAGARMGVARDELIKFTRTSAMMAEAFEMPAAQLSEDMGKIAGLYKIPIPAIGELADTINYLDDNAISKGGDIIDFMTRVGGVAGAVKITSKEVAAMGSTLLTLGERAETAGTATNAMLQKFAAADKGTKKFKSAMAEIGLSTSEMQKGMQVDAMGQMLKVLDAVAKLPADQRIGVLTELVGLEHSDTLAKLAVNTGELRKQLGLANGEMAKGSMQREFAARLETTNAQLDLAKNNLKEVGVNIGSVMLPAVNKGIGVFKTFTGGIADFASENKTLVGNLLAVGGTVLGMFAGLKTGTMLIGGMTLAWNALKLAMMTNPIGLIVTALATGAVLIYKNWDFISMKIGDVFEKIAAGWQKISGAWRAVTGFFGGGGGEGGQTASAPAAKAAPKLPGIPSVSSRMPTVATNTTNNFQITQLPGQSSDDLAKAIMRKQQEQQRTRSRSMMFDPVSP